MKRAYTWLTIVLLSAASPLSSDAQILKNLVNNMKNSIGNKAAGQPGAGKTDSSARSKAGYDSTYLTQLMAKANKPKPSISPADSAAAIKSFMTGMGGGGLLYQYRITYSFSIKKKDSISRDTMSVAFTDGHNARTDMGMLGSRMVVLGHAGMPRYSIILHPDNKTYTFNIIDTAAINAGNGLTYQVTKVGNETVQGYNCIHSKMTSIIGGKTEVTEDIWTSNDVPGYALLKSFATIQNVTPKMMQALDQAGCGGMFVKMTTQSTSFSMDMLLIAAGRKTFPDSMFQLPAGYTQATVVNPFAAHGLPQR